MARESFVDGMQLVAAICVMVAIGVAAFTFVALRHIPATGEPAVAEEPPPTPREVPQATFYCG